MDLLFRVVESVIRWVVTPPARPPIDDAARRRWLRLATRLSLRVVGDGLLLVEETPRARVEIDTGLLRTPPSAKLEGTVAGRVVFAETLRADATDDEIARALQAARDACARLSGAYRG